MDWRQVEKEMERIEREKWADVDPVIKDIYIEHAEIAAMSEQEIEEIRFGVIFWTIHLIQVTKRLHVYRRKQKQEISAKDLSKKERKPTRPVVSFDHAFSRYRSFFNFFERIMDFDSFVF